MLKRSHLYRCIHWMILAMLLSVLALAAPAARSAQAADSSTGWVITSLTTAEPEICIGQRVSVFGSYTYMTSTSVPLMPLTGPDKITTHATLGNTGPQNLYPSTPAGSFEFEYEGVKAGQDQIVVTIISDGKSALVKSAPITVTKSCVYSYSLVATLDSSGQSGGVFLSYRNTIKANGKLAVDSSGDRTHLTGGTRIADNTTWTQFSMPGCESSTPNPGFAEGVVTATADLSSQRLVTLKIDAPKNFDWVYKDEVECDGHPLPVNMGFDWSQFTKNAPDWIEQDFLPQGGTYSIKLDIFEQALNDCASHGMNCSYSASLTLTREKGE